MVGVAAAAVVLVLAQNAGADEASGEITNIDTVKNTFSVGDKTFQWSSQNSMGIKLDEVEEGDTVKVMYDMNSDGTNTETQLIKESSRPLLPCMPER